jgi:hypothetical protein
MLPLRNYNIPKKMANLIELHHVDQSNFYNSLHKYPFISILNYYFYKNIISNMPLS